MPIIRLGATDGPKSTMDGYAKWRKNNRRSWTNYNDRLVLPRVPLYCNGRNKTDYVDLGIAVLHRGVDCTRNYNTQRGPHCIVLSV